MTSLTSASVVVLPSTYSSLQSSLLPTFRPLYGAHHSKNLNPRRLRSGTCRAEFANDAPIAVAIGGCILNSLVFPVTYSPEDEDDEADSVIDSADARFAVMGIISFIPYFNWLSWIFAWLDTGKRRYAVYAIVYLAPYLRSNLSLSPEDSWLPIASILLCIGHIQLEASIKNGDFQGLNIFGEAGKDLSAIARKKDSRISEEEEANDPKNLPSAQEQSRDEIRRWRNSRKPSRNISSLNEDEEDHRGRKD